MQITEDTIKLITQKVIDIIGTGAKSQQNVNPKIILEVSARHVHLSQDTADALFGKGYKLRVKKELSQPGEYLSEERVNLIGTKGILENIAVLGPIRPKTQVELAPSDVRKLGIKAPVKDSGDVSNTPGIILATPVGTAKIEQGVMLARRHIHMTPADAECFKLKDKDIVRVAVKGFRPLIFDDVLIRVSGKFALAMHIDTDEAGACGAENNTEIEILRDNCCGSSDIRTVPKNECSSDKIVSDKLITEDKMKELISSGTSKINASKKTIITSLAIDYAKSKRVEIIKG